MNHSRPFKAFVALITGVAFFTTSVIWAPGSLASAQTVRMPISGTLEVSVPYQAKLDPGIRFSIPQELGTLQYFKPGKGPMVVHLQTAHGHYQAQKQIQAILHYLDKQYGIRTLLVEGSAFKLQPELLDFFPQDPALTQKANEALAKAALVKGPELYLLDKTGELGTGNGKRIVQRSAFPAERAEGQPAEAFGIEDLKAYRENGAAFVNVLTEQKKTEQFLAAMNGGIDRLAAAYLNDALRGFLKRLESFEKNRTSLDAWLAFLKKEALKRLKLDLSQPGSQLDWPMLVRIFKVQELTAKFNKDAFPKERSEFLKALKRFLPSSYSQIEQLLKSEQMSQQLPALETGLLFEDMVKALPRDFNYKAYPNVCNFIGRLLLQSELKAPELMQETDRLSSKIAEKLAKTKAEKELVALLKDHRLLQRLFALELTPADYDAIAGERGTVNGERKGLRPSFVIQRFADFKKESVSRSALPVSRVKDVKFQHTADLDRLFDAAVRFYAGVKERDGLMEQMIEKRLHETGAGKVAVITGGFHADPFKDYFSSKDYSYALISPRIAGSDEAGHQAYVDHMLQFAQRATGNAQREVASPVSLSVERSTLSAKKATRELEFLSDPKVLSGNTYGVNAAAVRAEVRKIVSSVAGQAVASKALDQGLQPTAESRSEVRLTPAQEKQFQKAMSDLKPKWWDGWINGNGMDRRVAALKTLVTLKYSQLAQLERYFKWIESDYGTYNKLSEEDVRFIVEQLRHGAAIEVSYSVIDGRTESEPFEEQTSGYAMFGGSYIEDTVVSYRDVWYPGKMTVTFPKTALSKGNSRSEVRAGLTTKDVVLFWVTLASSFSLMHWGLLSFGVPAFISAVVAITLALILQVLARRFYMSTNALIGGMKHSADPKARARFIRDLRYRKDLSAVPALIEALSNDSDPWVRMNAAWAFKKIQTPEVMPALLMALNDLDDDVVTAVCNTLGTIKDPSAIPALTEVSMSNIDDVRRRAALWALDQIKNSSRSEVRNNRSEARTLTTDEILERAKTDARLIKQTFDDEIKGENRGDVRRRILAGFREFLSEATDIEDLFALKSAKEVLRRAYSASFEAREPSEHYEIFYNHPLAILNEKIQALGAVKAEQDAARKRELSTTPPMLWQQRLERLASIKTKFALVNTELKPMDEEIRSNEDALRYSLPGSMGAGIYAEILRDLRQEFEKKFLAELEPLVLELKSHVDALMAEGKGGEAVMLLIEMLQDAECPQTKIPIIEILGELKDHRATAPLSLLLQRKVLDPIEIDREMGDKIQTALERIEKANPRSEARTAQDDFDIYFTYPDEGGHTVLQTLGEALRPHGLTRDQLKGLNFVVFDREGAYVSRGDGRHEEMDDVSRAYVTVSTAAKTNIEIEIRSLSNAHGWVQHTLREVFRQRGLSVKVLDQMEVRSFNQSGGEVMVPGLDQSLTNQIRRITVRFPKGDDKNQVRSEMRGEQTPGHKPKFLAKSRAAASRLLAAVSRRGGVAKKWIWVTAVISLPFAIPIALGYGIFRFFHKRSRERVTAEGVRQIRLSPENMQALNELREVFLRGVNNTERGASIPFTESLLRGFHNTMLGILLTAGVIAKHDFWADQKFVEVLGEIATDFEDSVGLLDRLLAGPFEINPQFDAALKEAGEKNYSGVSGELSRLFRNAEQRESLLTIHRAQVQTARTLLADAKTRITDVIGDLSFRSEIRKGITRRQAVLGMLYAAVFAGFVGCGGGGGGGGVDAAPSSPEVPPVTVADPVGEWSMRQNGDEYRLLFGGDQYASIQKNGYIRLTLTPGQHVGWGTSFVTPSYWTGGQYYHNMSIENVNIQPSGDGTMVLTGRLESEHLFANNLRIVFGRPRGDHTFMDVSYTLQAKGPISFDVADHPYEYLKGPQFSSMNVGSAHDSNQLYTSNGQYSIQNSTGALNPSPQWNSSPVTAALVNTTRGPSSFGELKPTAYIQVGSAPSQVAVQGWLQQESDPNADNVGAWFAMQSPGYVSFRAGVIPPGAFSIRPEMSPPAPVTQPLGPQLPPHTPAELAGLPGNPDEAVVYAPGASATAAKTDRGIYIAFDTGSTGWSGGGFTFDDFSTGPVETADLNSLSDMRFEIYGQIPPGVLIKMEVVDADDRKAAIYLDQIAAETGKVWRIPRAAMDQYGPVDMSRIRLIYFIMEGNGAGFLYVNDKPPRSEMRWGEGQVKLSPESVQTLIGLENAFSLVKEPLSKIPELDPFTRGLIGGFYNSVSGVLLFAKESQKGDFLVDQKFFTKMLGNITADFKDSIGLLDMLLEGPFEIGPQLDGVLKEAIGKNYSLVSGELSRLIRDPVQRKLLRESYRIQIQEVRDFLVATKATVEGVARDFSSRSEIRSAEANPLAGIVREYYAHGTTDEFMPPILLIEDYFKVLGWKFTQPFVIKWVEKIQNSLNVIIEFLRGQFGWKGGRLNWLKNDKGRIRDGDSVVFWNFRGDRGREIAKAFLDPKVQADPAFAGMRSPQNLTYVTLTDYEQGLVPPENVAYPAAPLKGTIGEIVSNAGLRQFRISETEKYAHVTFFFNGGLESEFPGEERKVIPSPKEVKTYDLKPEMSVGSVTDAVLERLKSRKDHMIILNFPNADMVGHTGNFQAVQKAIEAVDSHLGRVVAEAQTQGVHTVIIADHGNAEEMGPADNRQTNHSKNPVPFIFIPAEKGVKKQGIVPDQGRLADVAPTMLEVMGLSQPPEMTGKSLLQGFEFSREEQQKVLLIILDGWGHNPDRQDPNDAIRTANTPNMDSYLQKYPHTLLISNGLNVGLPGDTMGSSEVGHSNIGGGRVDDQPVVVIDKAIESGEFFKNPALLKAVRNAKKNHGALHLMGLLSDGLVHSKMDHIDKGLLELARREGLKEVYLHAILDGRDTPPQSGVQWLDDMQARVDQKGVGKIVDAMGRFYPMDRDKRWERVAVGYKAYVSGPEAYQNGEKIFADGKEVPFIFVYPRASSTIRSEMRDDTGEQRLVAAIEDGMRKLETLRWANSAQAQGVIQELQRDIVSYQRALLYVGGIGDEVELPAILAVAPPQTVYEIYRAAGKVLLPDLAMEVPPQDMVRFFYGVMPQGQATMMQKPEFQTYITLVTQNAITSEDKGLLLSKSIADAREAFVRAYAPQLRWIEQTALWLPLPELPKMLHEERPLANGAAPIRIVAERTVPAKAGTKEAVQLQTGLFGVFLKNLVIANVKNERAPSPLKFKALISEAKLLLAALLALPAEAGRLSRNVSPRSEVRLEKLGFNVVPIQNAQKQTVMFTVSLWDRKHSVSIGSFGIPVKPGTGQQTYKIDLPGVEGKQGDRTAQFAVTLNDQGILVSIGNIAISRPTKNITAGSFAKQSDGKAASARFEAVQDEMKAFLESKIGQPWGPDLFRAVSGPSAGGPRSEARSGKLSFGVNQIQNPNERVVLIYDKADDPLIGSFSIRVLPRAGQQVYGIYFSGSMGKVSSATFAVTLSDQRILESVGDIVLSNPEQNLSEEQLRQAIDVARFRNLQVELKAFLESKIGQPWGPDLFRSSVMSIQEPNMVRTANGVNVPEASTKILGEMADEVPGFSVEWSRKELKGFTAEITKALKYWAPVLYTRRPLDIARAKENRAGWQAQQFTHELPVAAQLLKKIALELTREEISRLTARDFEEVISTLRRAVADGRTLERAGRAPRVPKSYDRLEVLANSPDSLKAALNKFKTIYEAEIQQTQAAPSETPAPRRSELRLSSFTDVLTPEKITLIEHFYFSILPVQLRELIEAAGGREAVLETLRKIPGVTVNEMRMNIRETNVLDGVFAPEASLAIPETAGKGLAVVKTVMPTVKNLGGKVFLGQDILIRLMAENPRALFYLLKTYAVFVEQNESPVLLTVGSPDLISQIGNALYNRNSGLRGFEIPERAALMESLEAGKILQVIKPAQGASEAQVIGLEADRTNGAIASLHLSAAMIPGSTKGVHFAFGENVGARDLMVASVFAIVLKSAADLLRNVPDAKTRAELLNKFFEENLPGIQMKKQGSNSFVITQITMLAQEFAARAYIATKA